MFKRYNIIIGLLLLFVFLACPNDTKPTSTTKPTPTPTPEPSQDEKTYLKIGNNTQYAVNVYINDPPLYNTPTGTLRTVPAKGTGQWELQPTEEGKNGETLYFEYLIPVGSTTIPYYPRNTENVKLKKLEKGMVNTQEVPDLGSAQTDSAFVLIKNNSNDTIWFEQGISGGVSATKYPFGSSNRDISAKSDAVFVFGSDVASLQNCTIGNTTRRNFPNTPIVKGYVYTFIYDGKNDPGLFLMESFDPAMVKNIWSIPTSNNIGKFLQMGKQRVRRNPSDGIIILGRLEYNWGIRINSRAYFALVNQYGEVTTERIFSLPNDPRISFLEVLEKANGDFIISYVASYETENKMFLMCYTQNGVTKWQIELNENLFPDFDPDTCYIEGTYITEKDNKTFAIGGLLQEYRPDGWHLAAFVTEVKENAMGTGASLSWTESYISDFTPYKDDGVSLLSTRNCRGLIYNSSLDAYIVIEIYVDNKKEEGIYQILRASDGSIIGSNSPKEFANFGFMGIHQDNNRYYVYGEYLDANEKYSAAALGFKSDMTLDPNFTTVLIPSDAGYSEFDACDSDSFKIVFAGKIYNGNKWIPWTYAVDKTNGSKLWENVYDDVDYGVIWNMDINSIGTLQLEFWDSENTGSSLLVSTDLFGKISGERKAPIPRNSSMTVTPPAEIGISVIITPLSDAGLSAETLTLNKGQSGTISVQGTWSSYQWYINGEPVSGSSGSGSSLSFTTSGRSAGVYTVTAVVTDNANEKRSASCRVTVIN